MHRHPLGKSGLTVSRLGFGAWPIGGTTYGNTSKEDGLLAVRAYLGLGGRLIDTARGYRASESIIGEALRTVIHRSDLIIASKTKANIAEAMRFDLEASLQALGTDYLDIYYLHEPPSDPTGRDDAIAAMLEFQREGKIRTIGASIKGPNVTSETEELCHAYIATGKIQVIQIIFSIFRQRLRSILSLAQSQGVGIVGRTALESGFLTGKYSTATEFPSGDHRNRWSPDQRNAIFASVEFVRQAVKAANIPDLDLVSAAIQFALNEPGIDTVILGAKSSAQARQTFCLEDMPILPSSMRSDLIHHFKNQDARFNL